MHPNLRRGHDALWKKFFRPENNLIYDTAFHDPACLPTPEEIASSIPNCAGWGTGMEDCTLTGGFVLAGMVAAHRVTGEREWADKARRIFRGLVSLGTISRTRGYVARGFAPGQTAIYPNSSADQYTSFVFGLWSYAKSAVATGEERREAARLLTDVARLVESFGGDIPREDMKPSIYGDTAAITADRACRVLQFYKAAHDLSGDPHWQDAYAAKVEEDGRARLACHYGPDEWPANRNVHCVVQSQAAFRLLYDVETDPVIRETYRKALNDEALCVIGRIARWREIAAGPVRKELPPQWRRFWPSFIEGRPAYDPSKQPEVAAWFEYCRAHAEDFPPPPDLLAEAGPALPWLRHQTESLATAILCEDAGLKRRAAAEAWPMLTEVDWPRVAEAGVWEGLDLAYWRGVEEGAFPREGN